MINKITQKIRKQEGFTLIEILVVIGIIAILATIVIIAINPARQFAQARDSQRVSNTNAILNAIGQHIADNQGIFNEDGDCDDLPEGDPADDGDYGVIGVGDIDLYDCLVPDYMPSMVCDPNEDEEDCNDSTAYDTGYEVVQDEDTGRITVRATPEIADEISVTR